MSFPCQGGQGSGGDAAGGGRLPAPPWADAPLFAWAQRQPVERRAHVAHIHHIRRPLHFCHFPGIVLNEVAQAVSGNNGAQVVRHHLLQHVAESESRAVTACPPPACVPQARACAQTHTHCNGPHAASWPTPCAWLCPERERLARRPSCSTKIGNRRGRRGFGVGPGRGRAAPTPATPRVPSGSRCGDTRSSTRRKHVPRIALHRPRTRSTGSGPGAHATPIHGVRPPLHAPASAAAGWRAPCALSRRGCRVCPAGSPLEGRRRQCWRPCRTPPPPHVCYPRARRGRQLLGAPRRLLLCPVTRRDLLEGDRLEVLEV